MLTLHYSKVSGNTKRFAQRLHAPTVAISDVPEGGVREPFVLICPTYNGRVPAKVVSFLNNPENRSRMIGVVGSGSRNFGSDYAAAGKRIAARCQVPLLHSFELSGLDEDVAAVNDRLQELPWNTNSTI